MITNETKELQNANEASKLSSRFNQHQKELSHLKHQQQRASKYGGIEDIQCQRK